MSHKGEMEHTYVSQEKHDYIEQVKATANETPSQVETHKVDNSEPVVSTTLDSPPPAKADSTQPRKSERTRTLTEKGQALVDTRLKDLKANFKRAYERWKHNLNGLKKSIKYNDDSDLMETMSRINSAQVEIDAIYLKIRDTLHPDSEIRRINDTCQARLLIERLSSSSKTVVPKSHLGLTMNQCLKLQPPMSPSLQTPDGLSSLHTPHKRQDKLQRKQLQQKKFSK